MNKLINAVILIGPPAVGKTSLLKTYATFEINEMVSVSVDEFIEDVAKREGKTYGEVWADNVKECSRLFNEKLDENIKAKNNLAIDRTNMTRKGRVKLVGRLRRGGYNNIIFIDMSADKEILVQRLKERGMETGKTIPPKVLDDMLRNYKDPLDKNDLGEYIEDWDECIIVHNGDIKGVFKNDKV